MKKLLATLLAILITVLVMLAILLATSGCTPRMLAMLSKSALLLTINTPTTAPPYHGTSYPAPTTAPPDHGTVYPEPTTLPVLATQTVEPIETLPPEPYPAPELPVITQDPYPAPEMLANTCRISTGKENGYLNLRACAGNTCKVLAILQEGDQVIVLDAGIWLHVLAGERAGYVYAWYCR